MMGAQTMPLTADNSGGIIVLSVAERNLILRLRSLRDRPRLIWLEVTPTMLAIIAMIEMKLEKMGEM